MRSTSMEMSPCDGGIAGFSFQGTMAVEPPAIRVAPAAGVLAPDNGISGSNSSDWVALPPQNNQSLIRGIGITILLYNN